jgi:NAD(P)-dependent dehydrogenase (short-subunit alcohol dehydrogenase family)
MTGTNGRPRVLVVGSRPGSLGEAVVQNALSAGYEAYGAGITGEAVELDVVSMNTNEMISKLRAMQPQHIVCTVGMNMPRPEGPHDMRDWYRWHFETNVVGPMRLLDAWTTAMADPDYLPHVPPTDYCHYVAISSNSARIPRTNSSAYCASKAALSMALRVAAREGKGGNGGYIVYGYEPGLLTGTPMTSDVEERLPGVPLHRMAGFAQEGGIPPANLAAQIVFGLSVPGAALNGCLMPYDTGEQ